MDEFQLIRAYFAQQSARPPLLLGIGDDAALLAPPAGSEVVMSCDTLVAGRHFAADANAADIAHKALAVNLSDLAAMGAEGDVFLLSLTLPAFDAGWLAAFAAALHAQALKHDVQLAGGDTTRGPLTVGITAIGHVPAGTALRRSGARAGDVLCVSGSLGDAAAALAGHDTPELLSRLHRPEPRLAAGVALRGIATAAIDVSDGLLADVGHVCMASGVAADVRADLLPASPALQQCAATAEQRLRWQAAGGDDYELAVAVPPERVEAAISACAAVATPLHVIGRFVAGNAGARLLQSDGRSVVTLDAQGYRHFD